MILKHIPVDRSLILVAIYAVFVAPFILQGASDLNAGLAMKNVPLGVLLALILLLEFVAVWIKYPAVLKRLPKQDAVAILGLMVLRIFTAIAMGVLMLQAFGIDQNTLRELAPHETDVAFMSFAGVFIFLSLKELIIGIYPMYVMEFKKQAVFARSRFEGLADVALIVYAAVGYTVFWSANILYDELYVFGGDFADNLSSLAILVCFFLIGYLGLQSMFLLEAVFGKDLKRLGWVIVGIASATLAGIAPVLFR